MASNYPGSLDSFDTIASDKKTSDAVGGRTHRQMHNDVADALEAVQAELGTDPAGTFATVKARLSAYDAYAAKTGAYTATVDDNTLNVTSGTFTLDLPAASTCTGKTLNIKNSGTGVVTLDGNSSETIEGVATFPLGEYSYVQITSTGSAWILTGGTADTGWRDVSAGLENGWTAGVFHLRRVGRTVSLRFTDLAGGSASANTLYTLTSGFTPAATIGFSAQTAYGTFTLQSVRLEDGPVTANRTAATNLLGEIAFVTDNNWPTSLPGSAV